MWATAAAGLWSGEPSGIPLSSIGLACGVSFAATGAWMVYASKVGKLRAASVCSTSCRGRETRPSSTSAVDAGDAYRRRQAAHHGEGDRHRYLAGRGPLGNRPEATLENATREGVSDRVGIQTADMGQIPFPDATFDVVVSCWAVHNLYDPKERGQAVREIVRVLKPGGVALIKDIRHEPPSTRGSSRRVAAPASGGWTTAWRVCWLRW